MRCEAQIARFWLLRRRVSQSLRAHSRKHSGRECFWDISPSGVFYACARYKSMCSIGQRTSLEHILRSSKRLEAVSNLSSVEDSINAVILNTILVHTNVNAVHGKPRLLYYILWVV